MEAERRLTVCEYDPHIRRRYNPLLTMAREFWKGYKKIRPYLHSGIYVLFYDDVLVAISATKFKMEYRSPFHFSKTEYVHRVYEGDIEYYKRNYADQAEEPAITPAIIAKLTTVLSEIEKESGKMFELMIQTVGTCERQLVGDVNKRNSYTIYDTIEDLRYLEGTYSNIEEMKDKNIVQQYTAVTEELKKDTDGEWQWKCSYCHSWGSEDRKNHIRSYTCNNCHTKLQEPDYAHISFSPSAGWVSTSGGGSISVVQVLGFIRVNP